MPVIKKSKNFITLPNDLIFDDKLGLQEIGLIACLLALSSQSNTTLQDNCIRNMINRHEVVLKRLSSVGYIKMKKNGDLEITEQKGIFN